MVASPLHYLTSAKVPFTWPKQAEEAFNLLKEKFTTVLVVVQEWELFFLSQQ